MGAFTGRVAIVVGGARGIGRAAAIALSREDARVVIHDAGVALDGSAPDAGPAHQVADEIRALGGQALALTHDVREPDAAKRTLASALAEFGRVDVGLYAAGILKERPLVRATDDDLDVTLDVLVRGAFRFARELSAALVEARNGGSLVLCSSPAGFAGTPGQSASAAAALALVGFARTAATELRRQNVRINVLVPTARTRLTEHLPLFKSIRADSLSPEHAAQVACHLLSDAAREISGEVIGVAGGRVYALRTLESPGIFAEGAPLSLEELAARFGEVLAR